MLLNNIKKYKLDQGVCFSVISVLSPVVVDIDGHWKLIWLLISRSVGINRDVRKLIRTPHIN
jgi:hypothetical protein